MRTGVWIYDDAVHSVCTTKLIAAYEQHVIIGAISCDSKQTIVSNSKRLHSSRLNRRYGTICLSVLQILYYRYSYRSTATMVLSKKAPLFLLLSSS